MCVRRCLVGLTFCTCYLASYLTNKYVLSVLKFTYPTLFQGWQTLIGGLLLHVSWKLGWAEINSSLRSDVSTWLPASVLFVGIIYAGSRALSKLAIPVFLTLHNVAEVILCGHQKCFRKEVNVVTTAWQSSLISRIMFLTSLRFIRCTWECSWICAALSCSSGQSEHLGIQGGVYCGPRRGGGGSLPARSSSQGRRETYGRASHRVLGASAHPGRVPLVSQAQLCVTPVGASVFTFCASPWERGIVMTPSSYGCWEDRARHPCEVHPAVSGAE
uniref:transmembrane protein 241 isoform X14 n=1 Tax=Halichoerus grypus TaxID=9711 RepID=UPI00165A1304|nr:transmembrane protein 241 isoform X14 [Halichoerus grypus]